ncbi:MAG: gliding motility-associated C-terminal domain-containing protein [Flavobacteriales bacterium]|nr:gliding motility-associated C-terminal domain-containing protein [Flavobacteriales bacterium]
MKLRGIILFLAAVSPLISRGQGWVNNGANLVLTDSVHVVITTANGNFLNKNNGLVHSRRESFLHLRGNWINNANNVAIASNNGTVILDGGVQFIDGIRSSSFNNLVLSGTGNKTLRINTLVGGGQGGVKNGKLNLNDKLLFINSKTLIINNNDPNSILRSSGFLIGETPPTSGYSRVQWTIRDIASGTRYELPFASTDLISIPFGFQVANSGTSIADSGHVKVAMYPTNPLLALNNRPLPLGVSNLFNEFGLENDVKSVDRFYIVESGFFGFQPRIKLQLPYIDREWDALSGSTNSISEALLRAVRYNASTGQWAYPGGGTANTTSNYVEFDAGTGYTGNWVLFNAPGCPVVDFVKEDVCDGFPVQLIDRSTIAEGSIDSFVWFMDGSTYPNRDTIHHTFPSDGSYSVMLKVRSDRGCWDSLTQTVVIHPTPNVNYQVRDTCLGEPTIFTSTSTTKTGAPLKHQWISPGALNSNGNPLVHLFPDTGTYSVQLVSTNSWGCLDSTTRSVKVRELPIVNFSTEPICEGALAELADLTQSGTNLRSWTWSVLDEIFSYSQNAQRRFNQAGSYPVKLIVENGYGCIDSTTRPQLVKPKALAAFSYWPEPVRITEPLVRFFQESKNANSFSWDFGDGMGKSVLSEPSYEFGDTGFFPVLLIANNDGECPDTFLRNVYVGPDIKVFIPNAFTPHGPDNLNSTFKPVGTLHGLHEFYMEIYNRWGELLYVTHSMDEPWDGTYMGEPVEQDNYLYLIKIVDVFRNEHWYKGIVTLLR